MEVKKEKVEEKKESLAPQVFALSEVSVQEMDKLVALAEKRVDILKKVWAVAVKRTTSRDWANIGGNPYLMGSGAEKITPVFGVHIYNIRKDRIFSKDSQGEYYLWHYVGEASWAGGGIECVGTCSSRDKFFAYANGHWKATEEVDEGNIMKSAYTNLEVNLVTRLLGLRGLKWEDLEKLGINRDSVAKVDFKKGKGGSKGEGSFDPGKKASEKQVSFMKRKAKDAKLPEDALKNHLIVLGYESPNDVPMGKVNDILGWIDKQAKEEKDSLT